MLRASVSLAAAFAVFLLLSGCAPKTIVVLTDPYWLEIMDGNGGGLQAAIQRAGYAYSVRPIDPEGNVSAEIEAAVRLSPAALYILSPLVSPFGGIAAREHQDRRFVLFAAPRPPTAGGRNVTFLDLDRSSEYFAAGAAVARLLAVPESRRSPTVLALLPAPDGKEPDLAGRFVDGFNSVRDPPMLVRLEVAAPVDQNAVRTFLTEPRQKNAALIVLLAPGATGYALDLLKDDPRPIVAENWIPGADESAKVVLSIDEDILSPLVKTVENLARNTDEHIGIPWKIVSLGRIGPRRASQVGGN